MFTPSQQTAFDQIDEFLKSRSTLFGLLGTAGTGKSFLTAEILKSHDNLGVMLAAPTHKAVNVSRRFLDENYIGWTSDYKRYLESLSLVLTGTTAQLLGIRPVIVEDEDDPSKMKQAFKRAGEGMLSKIHPDLIIIDEASMLANDDMKSLFQTCKSKRIKLLIIGDPGQLPPVKAKPIRFHKIQNQFTLTDTVRQKGGSSIIDIATALREDRDWDDLVDGSESRLTRNLMDEFLDSVTDPSGIPESERIIYIAYRNRRVQRAQEAACRKVYGHGADEFRPGELVIAERPFYENRRLANGAYISIPLITSQDELEVVWLSDEQYPEDPGKECQVCVLRTGQRINRYYLSPEDAANPDHPYNRQLEVLNRDAKEASDAWVGAKKAGKSSMTVANLQREKGMAWARYFEWKDRTIISFRHHFAITSHKSQGSTYKRVFVDVDDMMGFDPRAMYVAVTRPREELVLGVK